MQENEALLENLPVDSINALKTLCNDLEDSGNKRALVCLDQPYF